MAPRPRRLVVGTATAVLTIAMSLIAPPQAALAATVLDQQQPTIQPIDGGNTLGGASHVSVAQVIQAGIAGPLGRVDLPVECFGTSTLVIEVRSVISANGRFSPGATVLTSIALAGGSLPPKDPAGFRPFMFPTAVTFASGDRFALLLTATGPSALDSCFIRHAPAGDSYASGDGWFVSDDQVSPQPGGWLCMCDSGPGAAFDHPFRTYVNVTAPSGADLSITKTLLNPNNQNVFSTTQQIYQITVTNAGPDTATNVTVVDTLPAGVTLLVGSACTNSGGTLTCIMGPTLAQSVIPAGFSASFQLAVSFATAGSYTNTATVSANETDPVASNNTATHTQQVLPTADLAIHSPTSCVTDPSQNTCITPNVTAPGGSIRYDVNVTNFGPDPTGDVVVLQTIPATTTFVSITPGSPATCGAGTNANEHQCRFSSIAVGASRHMTVMVTAPSTPQALTTTWTASHIPLILDPPQGMAHSVTMTNWVMIESVQQSVTSGGSATTDTESDGATIQDPLETTVQSSSGTVSITERAQTNAAPASWDILGAEVVISAPAGSAADPLILTFRMDSSFLAQYTAATFQVFRNYSSIPVPDCTQPIWPATASSTTPIDPDPCVWKRSTLSDGDVEIVVLTSQASVWAIGVHEPFAFGGLQEPVRAGANVARAGRAVPLKFSLGGFQGMIVIASGSPGSRQVRCGGTKTSEVVESIDVLGGGLRYDETTDTYSIRWDTDPGWAGTCRELVLELVDGSKHTALFEFR